MEVSFFMDNETYAAFAAINGRNTKGASVLYCMGILLILAGGVGFITGQDGLRALFVLGLLICIYAARWEKKLAWAMYKTAPVYDKDQQETVRFEPEYFCFFSSLCNAVYRYEAVGRIMENDGIFALFVGEGAALLLDKRGLLPGQAEQLAALLTARTGRQIEQVQCKDRTALKIGAAVAAAVLVAAGGIFGGMLIRDRVPVTLSASEYSIRVVRGFEVRESDYYDLAADWEEKRAYLTVSWYPADYALSPREMLRYYAEGADGMEWTVLSDGTPALAFDWEDGYRYYTTAEAGSDGWWITEFSCPAGRAEEMLPRFAGWAETVRTE